MTLIITADDIINLLKTGSYPYPLTQYFKFRQKFPFYPSVEVSRTQPDSYNEDVIKRDRNFQMEIRLYIKYNTLPDVELNNQATIENTMSDLLLNYDFQGRGKIFLETIGWSRTDLRGGDGEVFGSISSVRLGVKDVTSTDGNGFVGAYNIMELNSDTTPVQFQVLNSSVKSGRGYVLHGDDNGIQVGDPTNFLQGEITLTYENTASLASLIQSLSLAGNTINCRFINGNTIYKYVILVGDTITSGGYSDVERATTRFTVNGTWT